MDKMNLPICAALVFSSVAIGFGQPAENIPDSRHVIGLEEVRRNGAGKLTIVNGALQFQAGKIISKVPVASIDDIVVGTETTQAGGKAGTVAKAAAIAAPYDSGAALRILLRTNVDVLTVSHRDAGGGLHYAILALPKGQGEQQRAQLISAGAHVKSAAGQEMNAGKPAAPASQTTNSQKLTASAIQIEPVDAADVWIPAEFRAAIYEFLVMRVRASGTFQKVFRSGDRAAADVPGLITLHTTIEKFKQGSQLQRELTGVLGATKVNVSAVATNRDGRVLLARPVQGKVLFFGENLGVTNDLAKHIAKGLKQE
jgi:hypothetical protein